MSNLSTDRVSVGHTPGPWSNERIWDTPASRIHARVEGVPMALAEVFTMRATGEKEANARLIAAAPDLLAACNRLRAVINDHVSLSDVDALNAAIAKAEGRTADDYPPTQGAVIHDNGDAYGGR